MRTEPLKNKTKYTASVFKDVEFNHGVNFVSKELYDSIGKNDKVYGMELFEKENIKSAVEWAIERIKSMDIPKGKVQVLEVINQAFEDANKNGGQTNKKI